MFKTAHFTGSSGTCSGTIPARGDHSIRIYGVIAGTLDTGSVTSVPNVTVTNVADWLTGSVFTAVLAVSAGGTLTTQPRALWYLPGYEYGLPIPAKLSSVISYTTGIGTGTPEMIIYYDYDT